MKKSGYTMIEILVVLTLLASLYFFALPFGAEIVTKNRVNSEIDRLKLVLGFARTAAINSGEKVIFCPSSDGRACGRDWNKGQIVITGSGRVLRVLSGVSKGDQIFWRGALGERSRIQFFPDGRASGNQGAIYYCPNRYIQHAKMLVISGSGRVRVVSEDIIRV